MNQQFSKTVPINQLAQPQGGSNFQHFMNTNQGAQGQPTKLSQLPGAAPYPVSHQNNGHNVSGMSGNPDPHNVSHAKGGHGGHEEGHGEQGHKHEHEHQNHYNPLAMPCDWEIAKTHAYARRTAPDKKKDPTKTTKIITCPCCGFETDRQDINYCSNPMALSFLGSGFTLFYNFMKYCIIILFIQLCVKQFYNLYTNYHGKYCSEVEEEELDGKIIKQPNCPDSIFLTLSMANKLNNLHALEMESYLNVAGLIIIMCVLLYFRKSQRQIDATIDEESLTPADYTICVKNLPIGLNVDYKWEIKNLFENYAVLDSSKKIIVRKVVLVYNIEQIIELEQKLDELVKKKKKAISDNNYNFKHHSVELVDTEIEAMEHQIHRIEEEYDQHNTKFAGIAFVSFDNEDMKDLVMQDNTHTSMERFKTYMNRGKTPDISNSDLSWHDQKLFLEQAPEPNDVDWEFIHITTGEKIFKRIRAWIYYFIFEGSAFLVIYFISLQLAKNVDKAHEEQLKGKLDQVTMRNIEIYSYSISFIIVLFNKFAVAKIIHYIVDDEKISSKTKFQVAFVYKYALALFMNAAIISFMVDIVILKNVVGYGGFIQNETQIFILNALFPPFVWLVDPWSCCKNIWRKYIMGKGDKSLLTQQEANTLMEEPDYLSAKRYSDVMKTMWFTFMYGSVIPLGTLFSAIGITFYYYIDYYNILRRRTVKESISIQLSTEMIELLEAIIFWSAFGGATMSLTFFHVITKMDIAMFIVAILYANIPMEDISAFIFPVVNNEEHKPYAEGCVDFDTDYDRENPITRHKAIAEWNKYLAQQAGGAQIAQKGEFGYGNDGRYNQRGV